MELNELTEISKERKNKEHWDRLWQDSIGENIYTEFKAWCNAYKKGQGKDNPNTFAEYLKTENLELTFWQRKHLAEKYFGYKYEYKHDKEEWEIKKV